MIRKESKKDIFILLALVFIVGLILSFFRNAVKDEVFYLTDTLCISDCLARGEWIGNYMVGYHGFLTKIPAALLFLVTGPSVWAATFTNIIFAVLAIYLSYLLFLHLVKSGGWALAASFLVFTSVFFLRGLPTFLRDSHIVMVLLLFLYLNIKRKNKWLIGLVLVLMLDTKESVFFMILPGYILWVLYDEYLKNKKEPRTGLLRGVSDRLPAAFFPSFVFLILMFCSGIIPYNLVTSKILGFNYGGLPGFFERTFSPQNAVRNKSTDEKTLSSTPMNGKDSNREADSPGNATGNINKNKKEPDILSRIWRKLNSLFNLLLLYLGKIFHSRTFSFTSMPRFVILPAFLMSFRLFRQWRSAGEYEKLILQLIFWPYLFIYLMRSSLGRYLLPVVPIIMIFFIFFLLDGMKEKRFARNTLIAVVVFVAVGLYFEKNFFLIKLILTVCSVSALWLIFFLQQKESRLLPRFKAGFVCFLGILTFLVYLGTSYAKPFQLGNYMAFGYNSQMDKIAGHFKDKETVWINYHRGLIQFYRHDGVYSTFKETRKGWQILDWVPKASLLKRYNYKYTYAFEWSDEADFLKKIHRYKIKKVALVFSTIKDKKFHFPMQELLPKLMGMPALKLEKQVKMKNKVLYIFAALNLDKQ